MFINYKNCLSFLVLVMLVFACKNSPNTAAEEIVPVQKQEQEISIPTPAPIKKARVSIFKSPKFSTAQLNVKDVKFKDNRIAINFDVANFKLGIPTTDFKTKYVPNDEKGQYIKVIVNKKDVYKVYDTTFELKNTYEDYEIVAFLCRSYNESLKSKLAHQQFSFNRKQKKLVLETQNVPYVLLNSPAPEEAYNFSEIERLMLDFYVFNADISPRLYKLKLIVNNEQNVAINKWQTYSLDFLDSGAHEFELQFYDPQNRLVSKINRNVTIVDKRN